MYEKSLFLYFIIHILYLIQGFQIVTTVESFKLKSE